MADNHPETALNLLRLWREILVKVSAALSRGDLQDLENLLHQTSKILGQLDRALADSRIPKKDVTKMIKELHQEQEKIITALKTQTEELGHELGILRKNKTSLKGYKQKDAGMPRFMNERT
jgi:septal ring factor EnvC (AmiA/AmiB activator)